MRGRPKKVQKPITFIEECIGYAKSKDMDFGPCELARRLQCTYQNIYIWMSKGTIPRDLESIREACKLSRADFMDILKRHLKI